MNSGVYAIVNNVDGKKYVGQSTNIKKRWMQHKSDLRANRHDSKLLQNAWNQYGEGNFSFLMLEYLPKKFLEEAEKWWIKYLNTKVCGYNVSEGGKGTKGVVPWDCGVKLPSETKRKISEAAKRRVGDKNSFYGKTHSDETKAIIRAKRSKPVIDLTTGTVYSSAKS